MYMTYTEVSVRYRVKYFYVKNDIIHTYVFKVDMSTSRILCAIFIFLYIIKYKKKIYKQILFYFVH